MSVEVRIKGALQDTQYSPDTSGNHTTEVDIPGNGLVIDDVRSHEWVEDAFVNDDGSIHVYVSTSNDNEFFFKTV